MDGVADLPSRQSIAADPSRRDDDSDRPQVHRELDAVVREELLGDALRPGRAQRRRRSPAVELQDDVIAVFRWSAT
jgi:hypothetical protein